jgi:hypothetical protein
MLRISNQSCAQHDSAVTHTDAWINLLLSIIAPVHAIVSYIITTSHNQATTQFDRYLPNKPETWQTNALANLIKHHGYGKINPQL